MTYANQTDMQWFWEQVDDFFARLTEAGGSIQFDGETLTLHAITGGQLGAGINLHAYFPKTNEAAGSMGFSGNSLQLYAVNGSPLGNGVDISGITSGLPTIQNTGRSLNIPNGTRRLELWNASGDVISWVTLP